MQKKKDFKKIYRPVGILTSISKVFERIMFPQMSLFSDKILSMQRRSSREGCSAIVSEVLDLRFCLGNNKKNT